MTNYIKKIVVLPLVALCFSPIVAAEDAVHEAGISATGFGLGLFYGYQFNDQWTVRAHLGGDDVEDSESEFSDLDYEGDGDTSYVGVLVDWRPFTTGWSEKVYFTAGLVSVDGDFNGDLKTVIGDTINVGGANINSNSIDGLTVDVDYDEHVTPYLGMGWRSKASGEPGFAFTAEIGLVDLDDPKVQLTANDPDNLLSQENIEREQTDIRDDLGGVSGFGSFGLSYRF